MFFSIIITLPFLYPFITPSPSLPFTISPLSLMEWSFMPRPVSAPSVTLNRPSFLKNFFRFTSYCLFLLLHYVPCLGLWQSTVVPATPTRFSDWPSPAATASEYRPSVMLGRVLFLTRIRSAPPSLYPLPWKVNRSGENVFVHKHISHKEVLSSSLAIHQLPFQIVQLCRRDISGELSDILKRTVLYLGKSNFKYLQGSDHVKMSYQSTSVSSISHMMAEQRKHTSARVSMHTVMFATSTWIKSSFTHATNASVFGF